MFTTVEFITSSAKKEQFPNPTKIDGTPMEEIAFVGRSNVGKSSLINHLTNRKKLAHVSSIPGKTQLVNFFNVDDEFCLVDLPGYGFTKSGLSKREKWGELIQDYLDRESLRCILLLLDIRHPPSKDDIAFANWAKHFNKPVFIVFTKTDKIKSGQIESSCKKYLSLLSMSPLPYTSYSIKGGAGRKELIHQLKGFMNERRHVHLS